MLTRCLAAAVLILVLLLSLPSGAQTDDVPPGDFNFVYSAVLGTGFYAVDDERVLVLQAPLSWGLQPIDDKNRLRLLFPLSFGMRNIVDDEDELAVPNQLLTFSFLPGIAWERKQAEKWMLVPILQLGGAKDMQSDAEAWLFSISLRSFAWWDIGKHRLGLGNRLLGAGQFAGSTQNKSGFMLLENGLDWNYPLPWHWSGRRLSASIFVLWQHYADDGVPRAPSVASATVVRAA